MIERAIPNDISNFETKLAGPFTARQTGCIVASAGVCFVLYNALDAFAIDKTLNMFLCFLCCTPFIGIGWKKPYGMTFEKFVKHYVTYFVLAPPKRKYMSVTSLEQYEAEYETIARLQKNNKSKSTTIAADDDIVYELPKVVSTKHKKSKTIKEYL